MNAASPPVPPTAAEPTVFQQVLRAPFFNLPDVVRALHSVRGRADYAGRATVVRGTHPLARLCAAVAGLPPSMDDAPLRVEFVATEKFECWNRQFGVHRMSSRLRARKGVLVERLGPIQFRFALHSVDGVIYWNGTGARLLGVLPLPAWGFARVQCREWSDGGLYRFRVEASLPLVGPLIRYEGWLAPA